MRKKKILGKNPDHDGSGKQRGQVTPLDQIFAGFISKIMSRFTDPSSWPLRDDERVIFVKEIYWEAKQIENRGDFRMLQLRIALERDLSPRASNTTGKLRKPKQ